MAQKASTRQGRPEAAVRNAVTSPGGAARPPVLCANLALEKHRKTPVGVAMAGNNEFGIRIEIWRINEV
jgi:hypothetical protein